MRPAVQVLAAGRALAESLMDSTVLIRRKTGETRNKETGKVTSSWATVYAGPARVRFGNAQPRDLDAGGQRSVEQAPTVGLPIGEHPDITEGSSAAVQVDDEGSITANPDDAGIVGTRFRIAGVHEQTHSTSRRLPVEVFTHVGRDPGGVA